MTHEFLKTLAMLMDEQLDTTSIERLVNYEVADTKYSVMLIKSVIELSTMNDPQWDEDAKPELLTALVTFNEATQDL